MSAATSNAAFSKRPVNIPRPSLNGSSSSNTSPKSSAFTPTTTPSPNATQQKLLADKEQQFGRRAALQALTGELGGIADASFAVIAPDIQASNQKGTMQRATPVGKPREPQNAEAQIGDVVSVGGGMTGTVRFVGKVKGKDDVYAGVELDPEFASKGKNSGDANGTSYFHCAIEGGGVFIPVHRAVPFTDSTSPMSPAPVGFPTPTPSSLHPSNLRQQISSTPRAMSPQLKKSRPSIPRPESPVRRLAPRPESPVRRLGLSNTPASKPVIPRVAPSPTPGKFGNSVRGKPDFSQSVNGLPTNRKLGFTPRAGTKVPSMGTIRSGSALDMRPQYDDSDSRITSDGVARSSGGSYGSASGQPGKASARNSHEDREREAEIARLRRLTQEQDIQLKEQAKSLAEMEISISELYGKSTTGSSGLTSPGEGDDADVLQLRRLLREKNDKINNLTKEFDGHRADFRSTIDTLELASSETERVYEQRVRDLVAEAESVKKLEGTELDALVKQMRQLEDFVQELEEGLTESKQAEADARSEVEHLRGEVERTKEQLKQERERTASLQDRNSQLIQGQHFNGGEWPPKATKSESKDGEQKDDEIRGLKAIIHSLSRNDPTESRSPPREGTNFRSSLYGKPNGVPKHEGETLREKQIRQKLEREMRELRNIIDQKDELLRESNALKRSSTISPTNSGAERGVSFATPTSHGRKSSATPTSSFQPPKRSSLSLSRRDSVRDSKGTMASWRDPSFDSSTPPEGMLPRPPSFPSVSRLEDVAESIDSQQHGRQVSRGRTGPTFAEKRASILANGKAAGAGSETEFEAENTSGEDREGDTTDAEAEGPYCELCETKGHDILTCSTFSGTTTAAANTLAQSKSSTSPGHARQMSAMPAALTMRKSSVDETPTPKGPMSPMPETPLPNTPKPKQHTQPKLSPSTIPPGGLVAGKVSGVADPDKWCALCENDGHDSVDCPSEIDY